MTRLIAVMCLMSACIAGTAHAELNDRTKKLLQTQSLNRPQQQSTTRNANSAADDEARNGTRTPGGVAGAGAGSPSPSRGAAGNNPTQKP
ncbi:MULTISPECIES: hypothetical protein [unclassified Caballeronia]|uniref:hypothetical protein n=1 Tax=unclassified Caballeronia TaxID=2646786 RepID=UPI0028648469|nr:MULTISPECIES: hypothetical protein [unclassified Caballeronia]MDR5753277.1 hypothetical protein [Caballeronia sp. LZ024]MDR5841016.1 hypothetical protein [Caballeronia sp. LZ031]